LVATDALSAKLTFCGMSPVALATAVGLGQRLGGRIESDATVAPSVLLSQVLDVGGNRATVNGQAAIRLTHTAYFSLELMRASRLD
jgi:hypothetical protein